MNTPHQPTNAEIDELVTARLPLIRQAAAAVCSHRADELSHEVVVLWFERLQGNAAVWGMLADPRPAYVVRSCRLLALRVVEKWSRDERAGPLEEDAEYGEIEWRAANVRRGGVGVRADGSHTASDEEVRRLFDRVARHAIVGTCVDALDLQAAFEDAAPDVRRAIREIASGYSRAEIGDGRYRAARKSLWEALV